jgi:hypothetical protein
VANPPRLTVDNATDPLSGGTITVDGLTYVVPKNLLVTLPSIAVAWPELFNEDQSPKLPLFGTVDWQATVSSNSSRLRLSSTDASFQGLWQSSRR